MKFRSLVEPPEPMRGLEVPVEIIDELDAGKRPPVTITVNGHSWNSRIAIMRGRHLIGFSTANREAAGVETGEEVEVDLALDTQPRTITEPDDLVQALDADPVARTAYDQLSPSRRRACIHTIESAKKPETRHGRIRKTLAALRNQPPA
ncbi:YdeI/OmpD-associated family protein [Streptomyces sp. NPDC017202]|uniref:YdeI/OmpD-associated family protein n=1 Tax=Streptomyces sp. NPDC017202 TaxID=3364981 RepID=UPI0037930937